MKLADLEAVVALARARQDLAQAAAQPASISLTGPFAAEKDMNDVLNKAYAAELALRSSEVETRLAALGVDL